MSALFANPWGLLALTGVPVVLAIHLLQRRRREVPVSTLFLLDAATIEAATGLPVGPIDEADGWCDDPADAAYNQPVRLPFAPSHERLWRDDHLYDLIVIIGHNDSPPVPFRGSAVFMHLARPGWTPTEGCIALARPDLETLLALLAPGDEIEILAPETPAGGRE